MHFQGIRLCVPSRSGLWFITLKRKEPIGGLVKTWERRGTEGRLILDEYIGSNPRGSRLFEIVLSTTRFPEAVGPAKRTLGSEHGPEPVLITH